MQFLLLASVIVLMAATPFFVKSIRMTIREQIREQIMECVDIWVWITGALTVFWLLIALIVSNTSYIDSVLPYTIAYITFIISWSKTLPRLFGWYTDKLDKLDKDDEFE